MKTEFPELNYDKMVEDALIGVVKEALKYVEKYGLPSDHYFYITLKTRHKGVKLPDFLIQKYPNTITIVLQYEFSNLHVTDKEFGVTLSFNNSNYYIRVPFNAITSFTDPAVNFSLQFNVNEVYGEDHYEKEPELPIEEDIEDEEKIISLDAFRKDNKDED